MKTPRLAFSIDFLESYSRLPRKIQKKVRAFTQKFQKDPMQSGLNFERIANSKDPKVRSVRIDQAYRAIVVHPPKGDVFLCAWVDHHDDAYSWAQNRTFEVNPKSGVFQLFNEVEVAQVARQVETSPPASYEQQQRALLFDARDDEDLLLCGVPEPLLASVRALETDEDLDALAPHLPADASDILYALAAGYDLVDAMAGVGDPVLAATTVDVEDFEAALTRPNAQRSFTIVENEAELEAILDAPLEMRRIFLHPRQRKLVGMDASGPVRVLGSAGTGKTVVLMHRANHLASTVFTGESDRVLVTTYTRNLALDLRMNLRNLCSPDTFARLEVVNLHSWADGFMRRQGHAFKIIPEAERRRLFDLALSEARASGVVEAFYLEEWDRVVQQQDVDSRDSYLTARRVGRGTHLDRKQRAQVWAVFERYRQLMDEQNVSEWQDLIRETRLYIEKQGHQPMYRAIVADEVQDFTANELRLLRTMVLPGPNDLFLVGDGHQRIYGHPTPLGRCGIDIGARSMHLKFNYRTTQEIQRRAVVILEGREIDDLDQEDGVVFTQNPDLQGLSILVKGYLNNDPSQTFVFTSDLDEEQEREFNPPLVLDENSPSNSLVLNIDLDTWFVDGNGNFLDPSIESNHSQIENNIKDSLEVFEDKDDNGEDDDDN